jgi:hypothetical protein
VTYRNLSAQALRTEETTRVGPDPDEGVTRRNDAIDPADRDAVSFANDVASRAKTCRGATPVGLTEPEPGALLQGYRQPAADGIVLSDARVVRGDAAVAFFTAAASIARPVLRLCERARRMLERRNASKRKANVETETSQAEGGFRAEKERGKDFRAARGHRRGAFVRRRVHGTPRGRRCRSFNRRSDHSG